MRPQRLALALVAAVALVASLPADRALGQAFAWDAMPAASGSSPSPFGPPAAVPAFPYSYAVTAPWPARQYVPYGPLDAFPFHGTPYGQPYDRWSWATLAGSNSLQRYYYPPVR